MCVVWNKTDIYIYIYILYFIQYVKYWHMCCRLYIDKYQPNTGRMEKITYSVCTGSYASARHSCYVEQTTMAEREMKPVENSLSCRVTGNKWPVIDRFADLSQQPTAAHMMYSEKTSTLSHSSLDNCLLVRLKCFNI